MRPPRVPVDAISFAAKFGFFTRKIWHHYFSKGDVRSSNRRLKRWTNRGLFQQHSAPLLSSTFTLNAKHGHVNVEVSAPPFVAQFEHDRIIGEIILKLEHARLISEYRCEAELKRDNSDRFILQGLPTKSKYPDLVITLNVPNNTIRLAIELELNRKSVRRYREIAFAYASLKGVDGVLFICKTDDIRRTISRVFNLIHYSYTKRPLGFGSLTEWEHIPGTATIMFNDKRTDIKQMVTELCETEVKEND